MDAHPAPITPSPTVFRSLADATTTTTTTREEKEEKENHQCSGSPHALLPLLLLLCRKGHHLSIRVKPFIIYKRGVQYKHTHTDTHRHDKERERERRFWCVAGAVLGLRSTPLGDWQQQQQRLAAASIGPVFVYIHSIGRDGGASLLCRRVLGLQCCSVYTL